MCLRIGALLFLLKISSQYFSAEIELACLNIRTSGNIGLLRLYGSAHVIIKIYRIIHGGSVTQIYRPCSGNQATGKFRLGKCLRKRKEI